MITPKHHWSPFFRTTFGNLWHLIFNILSKLLVQDGGWSTHYSLPLSPQISGIDIFKIHNWIIKQAEEPSLGQKFQQYKNWWDQPIKERNQNTYRREESPYKAGQNPMGVLSWTVDNESRRTLGQPADCELASGAPIYLLSPTKQQLKWGSAQRSFG